MVRQEVLFDSGDLDSIHTIRDEVKDHSLASLQQSIDLALVLASIMRCMD